MPYLGEILSIACALLWATAVMFFRVSMTRAVEPFTLNVYKNLVAMGCFLLTIPFVPDAFRGMSKDTLILLCVSGIVGIIVADSFFLSALNRLGASRNAVLDCLYGPFVIVMSVMTLGEHIRAWQAVGFVMVIAGVLISVIEPRIIDAEGETPPERRNRLIGIAQGSFSMFLMALSIVVIKPVLETTSTIGAALVRIIAAMMAALVWLVMNGKLRHCALSFKRDLPYAKMTIGGVVGTYLALLVWMAGYKYTTASTAAVLNQTSVFFIILLAGLFLHEHISVRRILGSVLGFAGVAVIFMTG